MLGLQKKVQKGSDPSRLEYPFVASPTRVSVGISSCFHMSFAPSFDVVLAKHPGLHDNGDTATLGCL